MQEKVLVVEDDPRIRLFLVTVLEQHQYIPLEAANGEEGMSIVRQKQPDIILLDILMPKRSGVKMYRELKTELDCSDIPVIILSGMREKAFQKAQEVLDEFSGRKVPPPEAYLEKPVEEKALIEAIAKNIGH